MSENILENVKILRVWQGSAHASWNYLGISQNTLSKIILQIQGMGTSHWRGSAPPSWRTRFQRRSKQIVFFLKAGPKNIKQKRRSKQIVFSLKAGHRHQHSPPPHHHYSPPHHHPHHNQAITMIIIRFESGNLAKAVRITDTYYELHLR